ncbi:MAG: PmoA family protein [Planctomyces sp.]|nr:PmoA family protein [Planctomyces sp.]
MTLRIACLCLLVRLFASSPADAGDVSLTKGKSTVKATINGEAFLAYVFDAGLKKPFFLPIGAAGSFEALAQALEEPESEPGDPRRQVVVVQENAAIGGKDGAIQRADFGAILTAVEVGPDGVRIAEPAGWISRSDVVPMIGVVTRLIDENPPSNVDRLHPRYYDHPHHKGVWMSVDEVNEIDYWAERGRIVNQAAELTVENGDPAVLTITNHWVDAEDKPVLVETTTVRLHANRLIDYSAELRPGREAVTFHDTKEGLFGIRLPNSMREFAGGGPVVNAEGLRGTNACWGKPSAWVDYRGPVGGRQLGVTLMDHPTNFRPSRFHVRDYGLFTLSPFGESSYTNGAQSAAPVTLEPGQALTLRYGLFVHADVPEEEVRAAYDRFSKAE